VECLASQKGLAAKPQHESDRLEYCPFMVRSQISAPLNYPDTFHIPSLTQRSAFSSLGCIDFDPSIGGTGLCHIKHTCERHREFSSMKLCIARSRLIRAHYTFAIKPEARSRNNWTMVSGDTLVSEARQSGAARRVLSTAAAELRHSHPSVSGAMAALVELVFVLFRV
jgi:hypothetical protein